MEESQAQLYRVLAYIAPIGLSLLAQIAKGAIGALQGRKLLLAVMVLGAGLAGLFTYLGDKQGIEATLQIVVGAQTPMGTWAAFFNGNSSLTPTVGAALTRTMTRTPPSPPPPGAPPNP